MSLSSRKPPLTDGIVGAVGAASSVVIVVSRFSRFTNLHAALILCLGSLCTAITLTFLLRPRLYAKHRTAMVFAVKLFSLLIPWLFGSGVRLFQSPTDNLLLDLLNLAVGARWAHIGLVGLWLFPSSFWLVQQVVFLKLMANYEGDCSTELLAHPLTAARISDLHSLLHAMSLPQLHPWAMDELLPKTQEAQCQAAMTFMGLVLSVVVPALLVLPQARPAEDPEHCNRLWLDGLIEQLLLVLRFQGGSRWVPPWSLLLWWLLLVLLWMASVLLYVADPWSILVWCCVFVLLSAASVFLYADYRQRTRA